MRLNKFKAFAREILLPLEPTKQKQPAKETWQNNGFEALSSRRDPEQEQYLENFEMYSIGPAKPNVELGSDILNAYKELKKIMVKN